jgi:hypothetical protein
MENPAKLKIKNEEFRSMTKRLITFVFLTLACLSANAQTNVASLPFTPAVQVTVGLNFTNYFTNATQNFECIFPTATNYGGPSGQTNFGNSSFPANGYWFAETGSGTVLYLYSAGSDVRVESGNSGSAVDIIAPTSGSANLCYGSSSSQKVSVQNGLTYLDQATELYSGSALYGTSGTVISTPTFQAGTITITNGFSTGNTNVLQPGTQNSWSGQFATINSGWTNTWGTNAQADVIGTSGSILFYNRGGVSGVTATANPIWTNTIIASGENFTIGAGCGFQVLSGVSVTAVVYGQ